MQPDPEKIENIKNMPKTENTKALQSFLGFMNYSTITYPLRNLLHQKSSRNWNFKCQQAFDKVKNAMTSDSFVGYFDRNKETTVFTDASLEGISTVIVKSTPNKQDFKLISYNSKALSPVQQRYSTLERELLAIV